MVLKKNDRQISFLHLYHHTTIFAIWWGVTYYAPGGDSTFVIFFESAFSRACLIAYRFSFFFSYPSSL